MAHRNNLPQSRELSRLQRNIDRIFEDFVNPFPSLLRNEESLGFIPACDIEETGDHFLISFDVPGVNKEDVNIEVRNNQLIVSGERKFEERKEEGRRLASERYYGFFQRVFPLPSSIAPENIQASYDNGVLQIAVPKAEESKAKSIQIKEHKGGLFNKLLGGEKEVKAEKHPKEPGKAA